MRSKTPLLAIVGAAALALTACAPAGGGGGAGGGDNADAKLLNGGTFTVGISTDPGTLDPTATTLSVARSIDRFIYARLIDADENGVNQPALAESWVVDSTTEATFVLKEGLTCEDGTPLTATDVANNFNYIGDPANAAPILGLQVQPGTTATGDDAARTVHITSGASDSFLLDNLGGVHLVCGNVLDDGDARAKGKGATGMYSVEEIVPNSQLTLKLREDFTAGPEGWSPTQDGTPAKVVFKVVPNETTAVNMFIAGELNAANIVGPDRQRLVDGGYPLTSLVAPLGQMSFNQKAGLATADFDVRSALVQALDLGQLRDVVGAGSGTVPQSLVTIAPNPCAADNVGASKVPAFDTAGAAKALDAAGWTVGSDGIRQKDGKSLSIKLLYGSQLGDAVSASAELIAATWKELGVDVTLKGVDSPGLSEAYFATSDWDVSIAPLTVAFPSQLVMFYSGATPPNGMNFAFLENEDYVAGVTAGASKAGKDGCADWNAAEQALLNTLSVVPYANVERGTFATKSSFREDDGIVPTSVLLYE